MGVCLLMRYKTCLLRVDFHPLLQADSLRYRSSNGYVKRSVMRFILNLCERGYRHFVIYVTEPSDLWVAEIVYFISISKSEFDVTYSIGLWLDNENAYSWMNQTELFYDEILQHAKRVFWRSKKWYDNYYRLERLYVEACNL